MVSILPIDTPLCPAGHLPLKGGDRIAAKSRLPHEFRIAEMVPDIIVASRCIVDDVGNWRVFPISPLEGEMPGRAEGGSARQGGLHK